MLKPPFKLASTAAPMPLGLAAYRPMAPACCNNDADHGEAEPAAETPAAGRARLAQLDAALHCSIIGTCLGTAELAKLMARCVDVAGLNDLDIHHEAVRQTHQGGPVAKALHKALDHKHDAAIRRFAKAHDVAALAALWSEALAQGEIPGGYWALLTHRDATAELRHRAFGDVHMLSHLVGAANRADIRRLEALAKDNAGLQERLERQQEQSQKALAERDQAMARLQADLASMRGRWAALPAAASGLPADAAAEREAATALVAVQAERRERAEQATVLAQAKAQRLQDEFDHLQRHATALGRELAAAEVQLREMGTAESPRALALGQHLQGRRILYVGGRPSSTPAIRDLVLRHGGEFRRHDGGFEDRKGLLAAAVTGADLVVFPVDCVDHDSVGNLKRLCSRQGVAFIPMRSASVTSFAAALSDLDAVAPPTSTPARECARGVGSPGEA